MANVAQAKLCVKGYGKNFKALRENAKLTQEQLGAELHYSSKTISNIESEQRLPSNEQLLSYKKHFNVSLDYLTGHTTVTEINGQTIAEIAYQRGYKDGYESATKKVVTALMEVDR